MSPDVPNNQVVYVALPTAELCCSQFEDLAKTLLVYDLNKFSMLATSIRYSPDIPDHTKENRICGDTIAWLIIHLSSLWEAIFSDFPGRQL